MAHPLIPELEQLAQAALNQAGDGSTGYTLQGVQLHTHRIPMTLQVMVKRRDGTDISLDECARLSAPLGEALEAAGVLGEAPYVLEVSSPGVSEELHDDRDFRSFRGFPVAVLHRESGGSEVRCDGLLLERNATEVLLNIRGRTKRIPREAVIQVRLVTPQDDN
ncbi:MAG: ribosome assembly cofactor RimP [Cyanobacteriota bacterium]|nr:ribosome assembly cofactor RimP [Cyanobacteriota bacterium]